jgi:chondroitin AC lyase
MQFKSQHDPLEARKSWFFFRDGYLCLGAGIRSGEGLTVATTVNQCLLNGNVTIGSDSRSRIAENKFSVTDAVSWVHHGAVFYLFPDKPRLNLYQGAAEGSWRSITHQDWATNATVSRDVFKLWLEERSPKDGKYAYIVLPVMESEKQPTKAPSSSILILKNEATLQAAMDTAIRVGQAVFHEKGTLSISSLTIEADKPCLVMWRFGKSGVIDSLFVSDPYRKAERINMKVNGRLISVKMPTGNKAGDTAVIALQ